MLAFISFCGIQRHYEGILKHFFDAKNDFKNLSLHFCKVVQLSEDRTPKKHVNFVALCQIILQILFGKQAQVAQTIA